MEIPEYLSAPAAVCPDCGEEYIGFAGDAFLWLHAETHKRPASDMICKIPFELMPRIAELLEQYHSHAES